MEKKTDIEQTDLNKTKYKYYAVEFTPKQRRSLANVRFNIIRFQMFIYND